MRGEILRLDRPGQVLPVDKLEGRVHQAMVLGMDVASGGFLDDGCLRKAHEFTILISLSCRLPGRGRRPLAMDA